MVREMWCTLRLFSHSMYPMLSTRVSGVNFSRDMQVEKNLIRRRFCALASLILLIREPICVDIYTCEALSKKMVCFQKVVQPSRTKGKLVVKSKHLSPICQVHIACDRPKNGRRECRCTPLIR
jgi:hypothetical protein